ncbi:MAG: TetR/AcrR family transcriptional regulator [Rhodococcus sp. (in: high G+C Gram-positive bacteria)]|uniref:TetR/AcrR family transcriptional regulator n=1 Tax=Rhodococcus sp. TaxID=1831 RepID=UPI003BB0F165
MNGTSTTIPTNSKEAILDAAEELMANVGYERASIAQICRESGLPVGSVYHHFGSKAGLLSAIMERGSLRFFATMPQADADRSISEEQRMRDYWLSAADAIYANFNYFTLEADMMRSKNQDEDIARTAARVREIIHERMEAVIFPYARHLGITNPEQLAQRLVTSSVVFTRGALIEAGHDLERLRILMADLYSLLHAAILQAAEAEE